MHHFRLLALACPLSTDAEKLMLVSVSVQALSSKLRWLSHALVESHNPQSPRICQVQARSFKTRFQPWHFVSPAFPPEAEVKVKKTNDYRPCPQDEFELTSLDDVLLHSFLEPGLTLTITGLTCSPKSSMRHLNIEADRQTQALAREFGLSMALTGLLYSGWH